jgi:subfamily B ATP-binding cassette protein MsbA
MSPRREKLHLYLRILSYLRPYAGYLTLVLLFNLSFTLFNAMSVWIVAPFIDTLFDSGKPAVEERAAGEKAGEVGGEPGLEASEPEQVAGAIGREVGEAGQESGGPAKKSSILNLNERLKETVGKWLYRENRIDSLKILCIVIFLAFLLKNLSAIAEFYWVSYVEQRVIKDLREEVYEHILWQPLSFFEKHRTGQLISRVTNDIAALNVALNRSFTKVIRDPLVILIFIIILFNISWQLTLLAMIVIPVSGVLIRKIGQSLGRKSRRVQERLADLTTILQESITGMRIIKAFSTEPQENEKFRKKTGEHFQATLKQARLNRLSSPLSETLGVAIMVVVLWVGGELVLAKHLLSSEDFIRFIIVLFSIMAPIKSLGELNNNIQISLASGNRVFEIMDTPITLVEKPGALVKRSFERDIRYEGVFFRYDEPGAWVLEGLDLVIEKNERIALVGGSGTGKTTIVNLLPRFYDVTRGAVRIDGVDVRDVTLASLRGLMGIVTQDVILFNDTVANNIAYGAAGCPMERIERAATLANAYDFIMQLPEGFDAMIGERGMRLSGGERQRISIARAILRDPPIMIFDEATSSLDSESELQIQKAVENLMKDRTVLVIAHRLSSVIRSDRIVLLDGGRVTDQGSHEELLGRSSYYRHIYELQFAT